MKGSEKRQSPRAEALRRKAETRGGTASEATTRAERRARLKAAGADRPKVGRRSRRRHIRNLVIGLLFFVLLIGAFGVAAWQVSRLPGSASVGTNKDEAVAPAAAGKDPKANTPAAAGSTPTASVSPSPATTPGTAAGSPSPTAGQLNPSSTTAAKVIDYLTVRLGPRPAGGMPEHTAARYLYYKLIQSGYKPSIDRFVLPNGNSSQNITAVRAGKPGGKRLMIAAGYDSLAGSPGALRNAAAVGLLVALAEAAQADDGSAEISFVLLGAGEPFSDAPGQHDLGANRLAKSLKPADRPDAFISLHGLGRNGQLRASYMGIGKAGAVNLLMRAASGSKLQLTVRKNETNGGHAALEKAGVPAVTLSGPEDKRAGTSRDRSDIIEDAAYKGALELLTKLLQQAG